MIYISQIKTDYLMSCWLDGLSTCLQVWLERSVLRNHIVLVRLYRSYTKDQLGVKFSSTPVPALQPLLSTLCKTF